MDVGTIVKSILSSILPSPHPTFRPIFGGGYMPRAKTKDVKQTPQMLEILKSYRKRFPTLTPDYLKYLEGATLTAARAIKAKCWDCTCGYQDGREDCKMSHCPLYPYMPYRKGATDGQED